MAILDLLHTNQEYSHAFHMYYQYVGRNKRYANIYKKKMEKIEKSLTSTK